jgi:hypothetical protein
MVFAPRGREHTLRVAGDAPARWVATVTPGGFEGFFPMMASRGYRIPEDMAAIAAIARDTYAGELHRYSSGPF